MIEPVKIDSERAIQRAKDMVDAIDTPDLTFHDLCATSAYFIELIAIRYGIDRLTVTAEFDNFASQIFD